MSNRKLLLADDSITIQKVVNLTFADEGIEVITVGDGDAAMEKFAEFTPDLVMADVNMPGLNGYELCEIIKRNEATSRIPVILLVGSFEPFDEAEANRVGANDFLTKPFQSIRQLVGKVTDLLNNGETADVSEESSETVSEDSITEDESQAQEAKGFTATLEMPKSQESPNIDLGDTGMDDEMIETNQISDVSEEESNVSESAEDNLKTQALTADEMREYGFAKETKIVEEVAEQTDSEAEAVDNLLESVEESEETETVETIVAESTEESAVAESTETVVEEKGFGIISEDFETPENAAELIEEADQTSQFEESETVSEETETAKADIDEEVEVSETVTSEIETSESETELSKNESDETELSEPQESEEIEAETSMTEDVEPMNFDDADLLELPPLVEETGIRPLGENAKTEPEIQPETVEPQAVEPQAVEEPESAKTLSPELIEVIANRVTEKLLDKMMKSLNADVVPEVTEQIIKEMTEDKESKT